MLEVNNFCEVSSSRSEVVFDEPCWGSVGGVVSAICSGTISCGKIGANHNELTCSHSKRCIKGRVLKLA